MFAKNAGVWAPVRKAYVNNGGTWTQFFANNTFEVYSLGLEENAYQTSSYHGFYVNGVNVFPGARSYNLVLLDNYGNITGTFTYDVFTSPGSAAATFAAKLNSLSAGQLYVIFTYDEPQSYDTTNGLPAALTSLFGGNTTIVSGSMPYRGAYLAMGNAGQAPVLEQYCGTYVNSVSNPGASTQQADAGCADGALVYKFQMWTTEATPGSPKGNFANLTAIYTGGNLVSNSAQTGSMTVAGLPFA